MKGQTRRDDSAESAYEATGSLFFSCIRIKFSGRHNAMYGRKDLFRHPVAMRGRHGYAEGPPAGYIGGHHVGIVTPSYCLPTAMRYGANTATRSGRR